jgi:hypothetical protein
VRHYRLTRPPQAITRGGVKLDNVVLVPASLLPYKEHWQVIANDLPKGEFLIVLPCQAKPQIVAKSVASRLREKGMHVMVISEELQRHVL